MPTIRVELFAGRTVEQKRALAQALTEATVRTLAARMSTWLISGDHPREADR